MHIDGEFQSGIREISWEMLVVVGQEMMVAWKENVGGKPYATCRWTECKVKER